MPLPSEQQMAKVVDEVEGKRKEKSREVIRLASGCAGKSSAYDEDEKEMPPSCRPVQTH